MTDLILLESSSSSNYEEAFDPNFLDRLTHSYDACLDPSFYCASSGTPQQHNVSMKETNNAENSEPTFVPVISVPTKKDLSIGGSLWFLNRKSAAAGGARCSSNTLRKTSIGSLSLSFLTSPSSRDTIASIGRISSIGSIGSIASESSFFKEVFLQVAPPSVPKVPPTRPLFKGGADDQVPPPLPVASSPSRAPTTSLSSSGARTRSSEPLVASKRILPKKQRKQGGRKKATSSLRSNKTTTTARNPVAISSKPKQKRIRRKEPLKMTYVMKNDFDVLLGRGGTSNHHKGNLAYRKHILSLQKQYKTLSHQDKTAFSQNAVDWVHQRGGRFLKRERKGSPWYIVTDATARQKVSQALREDHTPEGRALKKSRTASRK